MREMIDEPIVRERLFDAFDATTEIAGIIIERVPFFQVVGLNGGDVQLISVQGDGGITE